MTSPPLRGPRGSTRPPRGLPSPGGRWQTPSPARRLTDEGLPAAAPTLRASLISRFATAVPQRLGHAAALTCPRQVRAAASLRCPKGSQSCCRYPVPFDRYVSPVLISLKYHDEPKTKPPRRRRTGAVGIFADYRAALAFSHRAVKALGSWIASSESILRFMSTPASFRPCMKVE